jgi:hypothetical protein
LPTATRPSKKSAATINSFLITISPYQWKDEVYSPLDRRRKRFQKAAICKKLCPSGAIRRRQKVKPYFLPGQKSKKGQAKLVLFWSKGKETPRPDGFRAGASLERIGVKERERRSASCGQGREEALPAFQKHIETVAYASQ